MQEVLVIMDLVEIYGLSWAEADKIVTELQEFIKRGC